MVSVKIQLKGIAKLSTGLKNAAQMKAAKAIVDKHTSRLQALSQRKAVFTRGYSTGATKRLIKLEISSNGLSGRVSAGTDYSGYVELGTRKMTAQPFMRPAFRVVKGGFIIDLRRAAIID